MGSRRRRLCPDGIDPKSARKSSTRRTRATGRQARRRESLAARKKSRTVTKSGRLRTARRRRRTIVATHLLLSLRADKIRCVTLFLSHLAENSTHLVRREGPQRLSSHVAQGADAQKNCRQRRIVGRVDKSDDVVMPERPLDFFDVAPPPPQLSWPSPSVHWRVWWCP